MGLQFAFLNPALALLLVALFNATPAEAGWVLAVYNASGFVASLPVPAYADRANDYLRPMLACGVLTLALSALLAVSTSLPLAVVGLIVLGGPAGVGSSLLLAHLRHSLPPDAWPGSPTTRPWRLLPALGYQGIFSACAALTVSALLVILLAGRPPRRMPLKERLAASAPGARS